MNRVFSYAMLSGASKTKLHKVFPVKSFSCGGDTLGQYKCVVQEAPNNILQVKTLCTVVLKAPDNNAQENVCSILS